jgi:mRNA interferase HigB
MRIISKRTLSDFWAKPGYADAQEPLEAWYRETKSAQWKDPTDIKEKYGSASILKDSRVVFNIGGNKYRLVVKINFPYGVVYVRFVGTHVGYDRIDAEAV